MRTLNAQHTLGMVMLLTKVMLTTATLLMTLDSSLVMDTKIERVVSGILKEEAILILALANSLKDMANVNHMVKIMDIGLVKLAILFTQTGSML